MTTSSCWVRGYNSTPSPTVQSTPVNRPVGQEGHCFLVVALFIILNHCISLGIFLNQLKAAKVIPIYKSGPSNDLQNYRPISLFSSLSKIFKKIILRRLVSFLERHNLIIPSQFGYRHKHSTIHPILDLLTECF